MSSRYIISHLFDSGAPAPHGLIPVDGLLLPLLLTAAAAAATPYAAAQTSSEYSSGGPYSNFDPSTAIAIVVLVCAFCFLGFFSIYVGQCTQDNADGGNSRFSAATRSRLSVRGLDPAVIDSFPIFNYAGIKDLKMGKGALECAVCINEFEDNETLRLLPKCDHVFHPECIDAWLASHSTCPVCRANLTPTSSELTESNDLTEERESSSELSEVQNHNQISINVDEEQNRDPQVSDIPKQNRQRVTKLPRSHSTGHSLVQPGENCERYTLRLPEEVRKQIMKHRLKRTKSCIVLFPTEGSSRRGYRNGGEGSNRGRQVGRSDQFGRSDRWIFNMTPPFCSRTSPVLSPKVGADGDVTAAVGTSKLFLTSVKTPFDCLAIKGEQMSTRLPV